MPPKKDGPRTPSGRPSRAKPGAKRGGSKPHGPEPLTEQVGIELTAAQHARVVELAGAAGLTPAEWARGAVEEALDQAQMRVEGRPPGVKA